MIIRFEYLVNVHLKVNYCCQTGLKKQRYLPVSPEVPCTHAHAQVLDLSQESGCLCCIIITHFIAQYLATQHHRAGSYPLKPA